MKIKKKRVATSLIVRIFESVADDRGKKFVKNFFVRGKKKRGIIFHDPLNYHHHSRRDDHCFT